MLQLHLAVRSFSLCAVLLPFFADAFPIESSSTQSQARARVLAANWDGAQSVRHTARQAAVSPLSTVPAYALQFAPVMYLHSDERWFPTDIVSFLTNVLPYDTNHIQLSPNSPTISTLAAFSTIPTYLSSRQDVTTTPRPSWLNNDIGKPDGAGRSTAPVEILVAEKEGGIVDVFYFFFFAYNEGPEVLGKSYGNHVGDWEHTMIRFQDSAPIAIYFSQHSSGTAYSWDAIIKDRSGRPIVYIGEGDHACYALPGSHHYATVLSDETNAGTMWDIALNYRAYSFDSIAGSFSLFPSGSPNNPPGGGSPSTTTQTSNMQDGSTSQQIGTEWLTWGGNWGDQKVDESDDRQSCALGQCRYTDGPLGPYFKNLGRKALCQNEVECVLRTKL